MKYIDEAYYMQWHENGYITLSLDHESTIVSSRSVILKEWRSYAFDLAWDRDYWNLTDEELKLLKTLKWE